MSEPVAESLAGRLSAVDLGRPDHAVELVRVILEGARAVRASDVHLNPGPERLEILYRVDGVLHVAGELPAAVAAAVVARLKVLAGLLTYRTEEPQEGRLPGGPDQPEARLSTMPTLHGERAVIRRFAEPARLRRLEELGLGAELLAECRGLLARRSGLVVVAGPAGSGKTTTLYAMLRELAAGPERRSLVSLEDPIEVAVAGVSQTQVRPGSGLDLASAIRAVLRQDPEVIAVGEMRDPATAEAAFQAALTGHLVLTTFHAGSAADVVGRCLDLGVEPYILRSTLVGVLAQRLVRRLCRCAQEVTSAEERLGLAVRRAWRALGCEQCAGTGYRGLMLLAELMRPGEGELARSILRRVEVGEIEARAVAAGMVTRRQRGLEAVEAGWTSPAEFLRAFGGIVPIAASGQ
ncbi:MAG: hypothetical protein KatS3mg108_0908 [Isosphaeraceae bacterium]|nr:MAG: hypothetical protein KatS3mg108_0908 [Isosphaeraceae bacterium]